jgi:hypothetical protein
MNSLKKQVERKKNLKEKSQIIENNTKKKALEKEEITTKMKIADAIIWTVIGIIAYILFMKYFIK